MADYELVDCFVFLLLYDVKASLDRIGNILLKKNKTKSTMSHSQNLYAKIDSLSLVLRFDYV